MTELAGHDIGDTVRLSYTFRDPAGAAADPTTVTFTFTKPDNSETTYTYGIDAEVVKDGTGIYHVDLVPDISGFWSYRFKGTGTVADAEEGQFYVLYSDFGGAVPEPVSADRLDEHMIDTTNVHGIADTADLRKGLAEVVNVRDFGAVVDGTTDDGAALQAAIDSGAGTVLIPGALTTNQQIVVKNAVSVVGLGRGKSTIKAGASFPIDTALVRLGAGTGFVFGCRVENLTINCNHIAGSTGVYSTEIQEQSGLFRVLVDRFVRRGIDIETGTVTPQNFSIQDVEVIASNTATGHVGIRLNGVASRTALRDITCTVQAGGSAYADAILVTGGSHVELEHIHLEIATDGIQWDAGARGVARSIFGHPDVTNLLNVTTAEVGPVVFEDIFKNGGTNIFIGGVLGTRTDAVIPFMVFSNIYKTIVTGNVSPRLLEWDPAVGLKINGALDHDGTTVGFYGVVPVTRPTALTAADAATVDATYGAEESGVINNLRTRVNELETKLKSLGLLT